MSELLMIPPQVSVSTSDSAATIDVQVRVVESGVDAGLVEVTLLHGKLELAQTFRLQPTEDAVMAWVYLQLEDVQRRLERAIRARRKLRGY